MMKYGGHYPLEYQSCSDTLNSLDIPFICTYLGQLKHSIGHDMLLCVSSVL